MGLNFIPMSLGTFRGLMTGVLLVLFLWLVAWAWSKRRTREFEEAARAPLIDEEPKP
jgi:cytochrome c oxidase cbb3-type subunit 4